jgi:hypothetical protein
LIYDDRHQQQSGAVWSIALSSAMGNGILPRSTEETAARASRRWPWSRTRDAGEAMVTGRRA